MAKNISGRKQKKEKLGKVKSKKEIAKILQAIKKDMKTKNHIDRAVQQ